MICSFPKLGDFKVCSRKFSGVYRMEDGISVSESCSTRKWHLKSGRYFLSLELWKLSRSSLQSA